MTVGITTKDGIVDHMTRSVGEVKIDIMAEEVDSAVMKGHKADLVDVVILEDMAEDTVEGMVEGMVEVEAVVLDRSIRQKCTYTNDPKMQIAKVALSRRPSEPATSPAKLISIN